MSSFEKQKEHGGTAPGKSLSQKSDEVNTKKELAKTTYHVPRSKIYYSVSLPMSLIDGIKKYLETDKMYRNVPEFVADAVRDKLTGADVNNPSVAEMQKQIIELQGTIIDLQKKVLEKK